jgi:hypothetical protein
MARYAYSCKACGGTVEKEPLVKGGTGLGTWHCANGCPKRRFSVTRDLSGGKEKASVEGSYPVRRPIAVHRVLLDKEKS